MTKRLINHTPEILKDRGIGHEELRWGARLAVNTAKRWADPVDAQDIDRIDLETISNIMEFLGVDDIGELIELKDD